MSAHILTAKDFADHIMVCPNHSTDDLDVICQIVDALDKYKAKDETANDRPLAKMDKVQLAKAVGIMLPLLAMHEMAQEDWEGAYGEQ